jgi:hypothetical protein
MMGISRNQREMKGKSSAAPSLIETATALLDSASGCFTKFSKAASRRLSDMIVSHPLIRVE